MARCDRGRRACATAARPLRAGRVALALARCRAPRRSRRTRRAWLARAARGRAHAQLHRHDRLPARRPRRDVAARPSERRRQEFEKLVNLDGPAREVIRSQGEVRCYYPDAKIVRIEPRTFRNVFPSLSAQQQKALDRVLRLAQGRGRARRRASTRRRGVRAEGRPALRPQVLGRRDTGLLLKARILNERDETVEQFAFTDIAIGAQDRPRHGASRRGRARRRTGRSSRSAPARSSSKDTGWDVARLPPGFAKIVEGFRTLRGKREPVAHIVYSDGLVAVSVFIEPRRPAPQRRRAHCSRRRRQRLRPRSSTTTS